MAANDYFQGGNKQNPPYDAPSTYPYSQPHTGVSPAPPSYSPYARPPGNDRPTQASPFVTVFDDHVYPVDSRNSSVSNHNNNNSYLGYGGSSSHNMQDTTYYGSGRVSPIDRTHDVDNIPLQDRPPKTDVEMGTDHVYDAAASGRPTPPPKKKRGNVGVGQLGMFGSDRKRIPWVVYIFSVAQIAVFIAEIARNAVLTGTPIMIKPSFNPMIGPSPWVMVNMGARYVPCMHNIPVIQGSTIPITWPCPNTTTTDGVCSLSELCGFGGVPEPLYNGNEDQSPEPNQWFRLITPIFMHAGLIHIGFNLLLQLTVAKEMEKAIGSVRFFLVYISAGIFGNVMGANYASEGQQSTGASGSLFGIIALLLLDLLYSWQERRSPLKDLLFILLDIIIAFILGLLPGLDNFAHIGGFVMGIGLGVCVLHSPNALRRRLGPDSSYAAVHTGANQGPPPFLKNPMGFFKGRKPLWWAWWMVRAACLLTVIIAFIVLLNNFYVYHNTCSWCKYLSCVPISNWCTLGDLTVTQTDTTSKRDLFTVGAVSIAALATS